LKTKPRSKSPARKGSVPGNSDGFVETVFQTENFRFFSARFLSESTESWQESTEKNPDNFRPEYCFHVPAISDVFMQDLA
jgi:hypothetical protein